MILTWTLSNTNTILMAEHFLPLTLRVYWSWCANMTLLNGTNQFIQYITIMLAIIYTYIPCTLRFCKLALSSCTSALADSFITSLLKLLEAPASFHTWQRQLSLMVKTKQNNHVLVTQLPTLRKWLMEYIKYTWGKSQYPVQLLCHWTLNSRPQRWSALRKVHLDFSASDFTAKRFSNRDKHTKKKNK
jgi:hypothetical protein